MIGQTGGRNCHRLPSDRSDVLDQQFHRRKKAAGHWPCPQTLNRVNNSGDISWHKGRAFVSEVLRNEEIGLEQMDEDVHRVFFCNTELDEFNSAEMHFRPALRG